MVLGHFMLVFFVLIWFRLVWFFPLNFFSVQILEVLERTKYMKVWFSVWLNIAFDFVDVSKLSRTQTHQFNVVICSIFSCLLVYYLPSNQIWLHQRCPLESMLLLMEAQHFFDMYFIFLMLFTYFLFTALLRYFHHRFCRAFSKDQSNRLPTALLKGFLLPFSHTQGE